MLTHLNGTLRLEIQPNVSVGAIQCACQHNNITLNFYPVTLTDCVTLFPIMTWCFGHCWMSTFVNRPQDICVYSTLQFGCYWDRAGEDLNMLLSCLISSAIIALQSVKKKSVTSSIKSGVTRKTNVEDMRTLNLTSATLWDLDIYH